MGPNGAEDPTIQPEEEEDFCPKPTISRADLEIMRMNTGSQIPSEASTVQCVFFLGKFWIGKCWNSKKQFLEKPEDQFHRDGGSGESKTSGYWEVKAGFKTNPKINTIEHV